MSLRDGARGMSISLPLPVTPRMVSLAWGILSLFGFIVAVTTLMWPIAQLEQLFGVPHTVALGAWAFAWVLGSGLLALVAARLVFGQWLSVRRAEWVLLLAGAAVSAAQIWTLSDWTIARFGYNDPELVGSTSALFAVVAAAAVAGFGVQVAPRRDIWAPLIAIAGGVALGVDIVLENLPGLANGLAQDSGLLAASTVAAAVYIGAVGVLSVARLRSG